MNWNAFWRGWWQTWAIMLGLTGAIVWGIGFLSLLSKDKQRGPVVILLSICIAVALAVALWHGFNVTVSVGG